MNCSTLWRLWKASTMKFKSLTLLFAGMMCVTSTKWTAADDISFNRDIRPILAENCFQCHGPDAGKRKADLRLDTRAGAVAARDGSPVIVVGKPDDSSLLDRVTTDDETLRMPPPSTGKSLSMEQIDRLRHWISAGAPYENHWAFEPLKRPRAPEVVASDVDSSEQNVIDRYVVAGLARHNLQPSREADRATLIRRLSLDLVGLLPSPADVDDFLADKRPDAYMQLVERLLSNPHFGERWGRHWLDQARYADSNGYAPDGERVMWPYRDWVIRALNNDLPFDQFTIEQIAGDLLPDPTTDQLVATGFHRNTLINTEGGTKPDQFRVEQSKDRADTTGGVWLALTIGCAGCHDHKYDPISQREYYQLYAFFDSTQDQNSVAPTIPLPSVKQREELSRIEQQIAEVRRRLEQPDSELPVRRSAWERSLAQLAELARDDVEWKVMDVQPSSQHGATLRQLDDGSVLVSGDNRPFDRYTLSAAAPLEVIRSLRIEALIHDSLPSKGPGRASNGNFVLSDLRLYGPLEKSSAAAAADPQKVQELLPLRRKFIGAWADHSQPGYAVAGAVDEDRKSGWAVNGSPQGGANHDRIAEFVLEQPLQVGPEQKLLFILEFNNGDASYNLGRFRLSAATGVSRKAADASVAAVQELAAILALPVDHRSKEQRAKLDQAFDKQDSVRGPLLQELATREAERNALEKSIPTSKILRELPEPRETHVHIRGDFLRPGEQVFPNVPAVMPPLEDAGRRLTRLDLARWLVQPDHPLTARVFVNRVWLRLFGRGLVETENDFGTQGAWPTHPELLDYLADEFIRHGWSTKRLIATIVASATYRQSSSVRPDLDRVDPRNLLLGRQNRIRVEAEIVRDVGLAASGLLSEKVGGPSVFPPQSDGVYAFTQTTKNWRTSTGEDRYRRGMYTFFYRSAPHPMLTTFDVPRFNQTCTRRDRSNTPLQSLTMANDEAMVEMAQSLANRAMLQKRNDAERLVEMFRLCMARQPQAEELAFLSSYLNDRRKHFETQPDAAQNVAPKSLPEDISTAAAAAWTATARVLLNLDEFINRE